VIEPLINCFRIPELRKKIFFTLGMMALFRVGTYIPIPGVDTGVLEEVAREFGEGAVGLVNMFAGGALERAAVFGLSIMPYISASIIFQLLATVIKPLEELQKEGEAGQRKINQYTRYTTVLLCVVQGLFMSRWIQGMETTAGRSAVINPGIGFDMMAVLALTAGCVLLMWIGEQIDEHGVGNGISLIIMAGIIARMPPTLFMIWQTHVDRNLLSPAEDKLGLLNILGLAALYVGMVVGVVLVHQGQRRIAIQTAKQIKGRRVFGGQRYYLPLRVGAAGVIPIIFAQALLMFPSTILQRFVHTARRGGVVWEWLILRLMDLFHPESNGYLVIYVLLIMFFCFFWTAVQFNPVKISEEMKERGNFIPGIRPGKRTTEYFERVMTRITLAGGFFISLIAITPYMVQRFTIIDMQAAYIYGGTGLLIVVGVALDLVQKIENHLLMRHYDGFLKGGTRVRGRRGS